MRERLGQLQRDQLPVQQRRPALRHGREPSGQRRDERHLGLDRPARREGVRDFGPNQRHRLHRHLRPAQPRVLGQRQHGNLVVPVAGHQGLQQPRLHCVRGWRTRHAGVRFDPSAEHHQPPCDVAAGRVVQRVWQRAQHRDQRGKRPGLRRGHQHRIRRIAHHGHLQPAQPHVARILL